MENLNQLIVNAHKHNLLNSFCNNGHFYVKQQTKNKQISQRERERTREQTNKQNKTKTKQNSNSKTLFYKDCSLGSVKNLTTSPC